jgi:hypothetical protein
MGLYAIGIPLGSRCALRVYPRREGIRSRGYENEKEKEAYQKGERLGRGLESGEG